MPRRTSPDQYFSRELDRLTHDIDRCEARLKELNTQKDKLQEARNLFDPPRARVRRPTGKTRRKRAA